MKDDPIAVNPPPGTAPSGLFAQALECYKQGQFPQASQLLGAALRAEPRNPRLWHVAGATSKALRNSSHAEHCLRTAVALAPGYVEAHNDLAVLLHEANRVGEAIAIYRLALRHSPPDHRLLNNFGAALVKQGELEEALQCFDRALALIPDYAKAHHNRGRALANLGRLEESQSALQTAILHAPPSEKARFYRTLAYLKRFSPGDRWLAQMEAFALDMETLPAAEQMELNFALGKAYGDVGQTERSFAHFLAGNRHKRQQTPYDEAATLARLEQIRHAFSPQLMTARSGLGHPSEVPVFILGMPRSGSSLVEQILASHPQVHGAGECEEFGSLAEAVSVAEGRPLLPDGIDSLPQSALRKLGQDYHHRLRARAPKARRVSDKTLGNFLHIGLIHLALPGAKIIHTRRDAVDTCLSMFSHIFNGDHPYSYDLSELGRYWRAYERLMAHWRQVLPPGVLLEIQYEEMVEDLRGQSRRLLAHCGLDWNEACMDFHKTQRPVFTASVTQVREPIYRTSVRKWLAYEHLLQPLLQALNK